MTNAADAVAAMVTTQAGKAQLSSWGLNKSWAEGGEDPCETVWAHACEEGEPHWHYVTSGLADPAKVEAGADAPASGLGYELSFRLKRAPGEAKAPAWPVFCLQEFGWGIFQANMELDAGHYIRRRSVITGGDPPTELQGYYLIADPRLPSTRADSGSIKFLQLVGITEEELLQCEAGEPDEMAAELLERSPLGITDLDRTTPDADEVDLQQLNALQNALARNCLEELPAGVAALTFSTSATPGEDTFTHQVEDGVAFQLNRRVDASVKRIFALHWAAGCEVTRMRTQLGKKPNGKWSVVVDFEYAD